MLNGETAVWLEPEEKRSGAPVPTKPQTRWSVCFSLQLFCCVSLQNLWDFKGFLGQLRGRCFRFTCPTLDEQLWPRPVKPQRSFGCTGWCCISGVGGLFWTGAISCIFFIAGGNVKTLFMGPGLWDGGLHWPSVRTQKWNQSRDQIKMNQQGSWLTSVSD